MMRAVLYIALCLFFFWGCAGTPKEVPAVESAKAKHFLWKVSDANSSVWILGSVHFADSTFYPLDAVIDTAFEKAEELAVEINLGDEEVNADVARESIRRGMLPPGKSLDMVLPESLWTSLDSLCSAWNFPSAGLKTMRPWLAATTLSVVAIQRAGINPEYGIDVVLMDRAATAGKAIVSLETAEEQVGALSDVDDSDSSGIYYLKTTLKEIASLDSMVAQMVRAWKTGDDELLRRVMNEDVGEPSASDKSIREGVEKRIYTDRNVKMAESIANFLSEDRSVFIVVGAAHLVLDKQNVIELLRSKGLKVERF